MQKSLKTILGAILGCSNMGSVLQSLKNYSALTTDNLLLVLQKNIFHVDPILLIPQAF